MDIFQPHTVCSKISVKPSVFILTHAKLKSAVVVRLAQRRVVVRLVERRVVVRLV